jgi:pyruvate/2-oxoacid:ferredoxin oxidoreductase alpha subunit
LGSYCCQGRCFIWLSYYSTDRNHAILDQAAPEYNKLFLQTEDELSAGYYTLGAVMTGKRAFTSTSGPGNVLMQEPMSMAEMMRIL